jgi:hypothetical protein
MMFALGEVSRLWSIYGTQVHLSSQSSAQMCTFLTHLNEQNEFVLIDKAELVFVEEKKTEFENLSGLEKAVRHDRKHILPEVDLKLRTFTLNFERA